jgi:hypothetical protein
MLLLPVDQSTSSERNPLINTLVCMGAHIKHMAKLAFHGIESGLLLWMKCIRLHGEEFRLQSDALICLNAVRGRFFDAVWPGVVRRRLKKDRHAMSDALHTHSFRWAHMPANVTINLITTNVTDLPI